MSRPLAALAALAGAAALVAVARPARAQTEHLPENDWRQADRTQAMARSSSPQHFAFELRFGPYTPDIDSKPGLTPRSYYGGLPPYQYTFGGGAQFYFGMEVDYLPLRIPYLGVLGPGLGWGYTNASSEAKYSSTHTTGSGQNTSFTIMPMHLSAVLRLDELMRRTGVPLVPYGKIGLGMGIWTTSPNVDQDKYTTTGVTWGLNLAVGGMLALNFLDRRAAASLDEATGVNHAYLFGEWMKAKLDGLGSTPTFYLGTSTWVAGFAVDM
jgi:hypothetical protein